MASVYGRSLPDVFTDLIAQLTTLLRKEGQLARAEISENIGAAANGLGFVVGGAVLLIPALVILLQTAVDAWSKVASRCSAPALLPAAPPWPSDWFCCSWA